jgi:acetoacetyl-CoA synthetase
MSDTSGQVLWRPSSDRAAATALARFAGRPPESAEDYHELWQWSVRDLPAFWQRVWDHTGVVASSEAETVMAGSEMPGTQWFPGARLNYTENLLSRADDGPAVIGAGEGRDDEVVSWAQLADRVARAQRGLADLGVSQGDRVAAFMPNCVETVVMFLATAGLGAVWSSCSPDFGVQGAVDRFGQIAPKVLVAADGYRYNAKTHRLQDKVAGMLAAIDGVDHVVVVDFIGEGLDEPALAAMGPSTIGYDALLAGDARAPELPQLPFDHPLYVLYSSGTTGAPKSIVHRAGGALLQHLKEHQLHSDIGPGDVVFWFTTCGWMMWNWLVSALASGATIVCYDGSPTAPDMAALWRLAARVGVTHFGTSPKFLAANAEAGLTPGQSADLSSLRSLLSTGAPLQPEQFDWVYANVAEDLHLASVSGGTDLVGCFAGGVPTLPVRRGELQARCLGMAVEARNADGEPVIGEKGELVCTEPFPSMPVYFWDDPDGQAYHDAYFADSPPGGPNVWTHGDFIEIRPSGGVVFYGRSDTTLNPGGVRIGTAEIYRAIEPLPEVADSVVVGRPSDGDVEIVLCIVPAFGTELDRAAADRIRVAIRQATTPRHVPKHVVAVSDVPYTINGKKVEKAVRSVMAGEKAPNREALANPAALDEYAALPLSE